jgi:hypothetical protein
MPFPLAHPAAVLPLRRFCPRHLNFPALIIGSLCPDVGYFSGPLRLDHFSHRFLAGSFGFCLPVGLLILLVFYLVRSPVVKILPAGYRLVLLPLCQGPIGSAFSIVVSLIIGAWTHLFLDAITHRNGWLVQHLPILNSFAPAVGKHQFRVYDAVYAGCTFSGVLWLAVCYQSWLEKGTGSPAPTMAGAKWGYALLFASSVLFVALASRGAHQSIGIVPAGVIVVLLVIGFVLTTGSPSAKPGA